ncbi:MAG: amidohydrolase [Deltaproteobacteria bacterium]|nr:amidohydrolase [Deltaproteobacteria bacterium]
MANLRFVSADSHMMEPADLWATRLDNKFRDRSPKVIQNPKKPGLIFVAEGIDPFPVAGGFGAGRSGEELKEHLSKGYEAARPSGWDPVERIKDQDLDGVEAEVLYTTLGMPLFGLQDADLQRACFGVYNDWVADFCSHNSKRLYGVGLVSLEDIDMGVKELERIAKRGMRGAMIWGSPPEDKPYSSREYDKFWQAASETKMPLSLHVITGKSKESKVNFEQISTFYMNIIHEVQRSLTQLIFGGVLERFPKLTIVSAENDTGWFPHYMYRMDHAYEKFNAMEKNPLPMKPSDYVRRQMWATFQDDPVGPATYKIFGENNYMWASDFPHTDSTWPESRQWIAKDFNGVPDEVTRKIVFENAVKLYRMDLN